MASIIRIKRSQVSGNPATLAAGELAYSALVDNGSNGGDRLYVGIGTETAGNAANHVVIGGKFFTDRLDHTAGTLTANSALVVDSNSKIDVLNVDNLTLNGNTITSTNTNGNIEITPNGTGSIVLDGQNWPQTSGTADYFLKTNGAGQLSWATVPSGSFTLAGNTGTDTFATGDTLNIVGAGSLSTAVTDNTYTISIADATTTTKGAASFNSTDFTVSSGAVSINAERIEDVVGGMLSGTGATQSGIAVGYDDINGKLTFNVNDPTITITGDVDGSATMTNLGNTTINVTLDTVNANVGTFGSTTAIPVVTVNGKGLVTAVSTASVATSLSLAADTGTDTLALLTETLNIVGGEGIDTSINAATNTLTIAAELATSSNIGVASFNTSGFVVTSGDVALKANVVQGITTDSGALTVSGNAISVIGGEGIDVTHTGTTITVAGEDASTSNKGVASFNSASFDVAAGAVSIKTGGVSNTQLANSSVTIGSTTVSLGSTSTGLAGITELAVDNLNFNGNSITSTDTNGNITLSPNGTGTVDVADSRITGVATPVSDTDAANKAYVDNAVTGLSFKEAVNLLATTNVALTGSTSTLVIDGHAALDVTDNNLYRLLLTAQTTGSQNGIYIYTDNGTSYTLVRSADADTYQELDGASVFVKEGTTYANTGWVQSNHYLTDFSGQSWIQFSGAGAYTAGNGLTQSGTIFNVGAGDGISVTADAVSLASTVAGAGLTFTTGVVAVGGTANRISVTADAVDIASTYAGQTTIVTLGTVTTGTWSATAIGATKGGTGQTTYAAGDLLYASAADTLSKLTKPAAATSLLTMTSTGTPSWVSLASTGITGVGTIATGVWQGTVIGPTYGGTGVNNGTKTITLGGNFTHTGAHTLELTTTGITSVTLPTTGTLATLAGTETFTNKTLTSPTISGGTVNNASIGATTRSTGAFTTLAANGAVTFTAGTASTSTSTGTVVVTGGVGVSGTIYVGDDLIGAGSGTSIIDGFDIDGGTY